MSFGTHHGPLFSIAPMPPPSFRSRFLWAVSQTLHPAFTLLCFDPDAAPTHLAWTPAIASWLGSLPFISSPQKPEKSSRKLDHITPRHLPCCCFLLSSGETLESSWLTKLWSLAGQGPICPRPLLPPGSLPAYIADSPTFSRSLQFLSTTGLWYIHQPP